MNKTLLILAAGMGSRYGGMKQTEKFGPNGEFIIDYSIYDALKNGFNKVVFIIKEENYDLFKETIGNRIENHIKVEYVFQNNKNVPNKYEIPSTRVKPLGTAHAILCAKDVINEPFVIINADDFYGREAFESVSKFIDNNNSKDIGIVGYNVINTLTENGSVKRGVIDEKDGNLEKIVESSIINNNGVIEATDLHSEEKRIISEDTKVSMNMIAFNPSIMDYIENKFDDFLSSSNLEKDEFYIPDVVTSYKDEKLGNVKVIETNAKWVGVTYKEDKESVQEYINNQIKEGKYNSDLWS